MRSPRESKTDTVAVGLRLPAETAAWLKEREGNVSDAIRIAVDRLIFESLHDEETRRLSYEVFLLSTRIAEAMSRSWSQDVDAFEAFAEAMRVWIEAERPTKPAATEAPPDGERDDPRTVGRTVARLLMRERAAEMAAGDAEYFAKRAKKGRK